MMLERGRGGEGFLVRAEPLEWAEEVSQRMVHVERTMDGALFLEAEPTWAGVGQGSDSPDSAEREIKLWFG